MLDEAIDEKRRLGAAVIKETRYLHKPTKQFKEAKKRLSQSSDLPIQGPADTDAKCQQYQSEAG